MAVKSYQLIKLQEAGIFWQDLEGKWHVGVYEDVDITDDLFAAGMFEH